MSIESGEGVFAITLAGDRAEDSQLLITGIGQKVTSAEGMGELIVVSCEWSKLTVETFGQAAIVAHEIAASEWAATADGKSIAAGWHSGPIEAEVYYERSNGAHGWIDASSRKLTQAG
jgi:hypothetical protein